MQAKDRSLVLGTATAEGEEELLFKADVSGISSGTGGGGAADESSLMLLPGVPLSPAPRRSPLDAGARSPRTGAVPACTRPDRM